MSLTSSSVKRVASLYASLLTEKEAVSRRSPLGRDWKDRYLREQAAQCVFHFRSQAQKDLWNEELLGQISDGMWENTPNTGFEFWASVPTTVGGSTHIEGFMPDVRRSFNFLGGGLPEIVGSSWLETVQKTEPNATMGTVFKHVKEIMAAMKGAKIENAPVPQEGEVPASGTSLPDEDIQRTERLKMLKACFDIAGLPFKLESVVSESFLYASSGSRAGQFHYFAILRDGWRARACSSYGKIGKAPYKGVLLTPSPVQENEAEDFVSKKAKSKLSSGYELTPLAGVRNSLDPFSFRVSRN